MSVLLLVGRDLAIWLVAGFVVALVVGPALGRRGGDR